MHGVSAFGLLVQTGRRPTTVRHRLIIAAAAAIAVVAVVDFDGLPSARADGVTTSSVSSIAPLHQAAPVDAAAAEATWAAEESRRGTRPDATH